MKRNTVIFECSGIGLKMLYSDSLGSKNLSIIIYYASLLTEVKPCKVEFVENYISHFKPWSYYYEMLEFLIWSGTRSSLSQSNLSLNRSTLSRDVTQLNVFQFEKHSAIHRKTCQTRKVKILDHRNSLISGCASLVGR